MSFDFMNSPNASWTTGRQWFGAEEERAARESGSMAGPLGGSPLQAVHTTILNDTDLPDDLVQMTVQQLWETGTFFEEQASLTGAQSTFQTYVNDGSLLARHRYRTPTNTIEEMKLARDLAERDDDIRAIIGGMTALAFEHVEHHAKDQRTLELFRQIGGPREMDLLHTLEEMYREYLITSTVTTVKLLVPSLLKYSADSAEGEYLANPTMVPVRVLSPRVGVLPGENIRVVGSDLFGDHALAYWPGDDPKLSKFLLEFFDPKTSAARRAEMRRQDPVSTTLFIAPVVIQEQQTFLPGATSTAYLMNPAMVHRTTMPKGYWPYPRPLLAAVFSLLEAKRLLNIMDFALLQGAANYIVVAKKGSDQRPALPNEIVQLRELVRHLGRTGVVVGDHRLSFEILTPELNDLLAQEKRDLISKHISMALMRKPENVTGEGAALAETESEWIARVIETDRNKLIRHIVSFVYEDVVSANDTLFKGCPTVWAPKIILLGTQFFTDLVLKLRDRGDIPRRWAVQAAGFDFGAAVAERQREIDANIDEIMLPAAVPYTVPAGVQDQNSPADKYATGRAKPPAQVNDNGGGRPNGARTGTTTKDPARPQRTIHRNAGETVKAWREEGMDTPYRMGELTRAILQQYDDVAETGRLQPRERELLTAGGGSSGGLTIIPVNDAHETASLSAVRLAPGLALYVGTRPDGAIVAKGLGFREPEFDELTAQEMAMQWGFDPSEGDET